MVQGIFESHVTVWPEQIMKIKLACSQTYAKLSTHIYNVPTLIHLSITLDV